MQPPDPRQPIANELNANQQRQLDEYYEQQRRGQIHANQQGTPNQADREEKQLLPPYDLLPVPSRSKRLANQSQSQPPTHDEGQSRAEYDTQRQDARYESSNIVQREPTPMWPLALALVFIAGAVIWLLSSTNSANSVFWTVLINAAILAAIAVWFGYGLALLVKGVMGEDGQQTFTGALVVTSAIAVPYLLLAGGILQLVAQVGK